MAGEGSRDATGDGSREATGDGSRDATGDATGDGPRDATGDASAAKAGPGFDPAGDSAVGAPDAPAATMRMVGGSPTEEELAAAHSVIMAVLAEQAARGAELLEPPIDRWRGSARAMRRSLTPGPGAWAATSGMRGC